MSALLVMKYIGQSGVGGGAVFFGKGVVAGVDVLGGKYDGSYVEADGRVKGAVRMTAPPEGANLVTGQAVPGNATFDLNFDFPADFANGKPQTMTGVGGRPIQVSFEKVRDLP
jgi:hypothetical protein